MLSTSRKIGPKSAICKDNQDRHTKLPNIYTKPEADAQRQRSDFHISESGRKLMLRGGKDTCDSFVSDVSWILYHPKDVMISQEEAKLAAAKKPTSKLYTNIWKGGIKPTIKRASKVQLACLREESGNENIPEVDIEY